MLDRMKEDLGLTDDQVAQLKPMDDAIQADMEKTRDEMEKGTFDPDTMRERMEKTRDAMDARLREVLTPEQWERLQSFSPFGPGAGPQGEDLGEGPPAAANDAAQAQLVLGAEEKASVLALVKRVVELQHALVRNDERRRHDLRKLLETSPGTNEAELAALAVGLSTARSGHGADVTALEKARAELRAAVNVVNEAKLVVLGILD
jgi:hypothetical protein